MFSGSFLYSVKGNANAPIKVVGGGILNAFLALLKRETLDANPQLKANLTFRTKKKLGVMEPPL
jgi:hypothetical protein